MAALAGCLALALAGSACASDEATDTPDGGATTTVAGADRPDGPSADVSEEIVGESAPFMGSATAAVVPDGYVEEELVAAGTAVEYVDVAGTLPSDGEWELAPGAEADYRTRVVVRRPADPADASGTVVVEWLNVSGGLDANPEYASFEEEIVRQGHTWVGVSAQLIGVAGGPVLVSVPGAEGVVGRGLVALDPERYGTLEHPGDGFSFDIFTQVARAVRDGGAFVGGVVPEVVLAAGESQSAIALTTYYDGVQPLTEAFDGFFIHSRASVALPLVAQGEYADLAGSIAAAGGPVLLRTDLSAPVLVLQAEGDTVGLLDSASARQPDSDTIRLWEVAGTSHADAHLLGPVADGLDCGAPINAGPLHLVAKAGLRALDTWVRTGDAPPSAALIETSGGDEVVIVRDGDGIAVGGIRTPPVDVPVDVLSGEPGPSPDVICLLMGSARPLADERLAERYASVADYTEEYAAAVDAAIDGGYVLDDDREALLGFSQPDRIGS